ncbi:MAG TPA: 2Fe-2S iron-sulfur cluster-binding protein, partial [Aggregatilineales bacterium]|nr:2Fe-2S iron-sulfur cluster-binding protein [Aggregatilineales bacterium]
MHSSNDDGVRVIFMPSGRRGRVPVGTTLLDAARSVGVEIESICGGRLVCGKCKVRVEEGVFQKHGIVSLPDNVSPPSDDERAYLIEHNIEGYRLSCAARALGDLLVTVPEESQARKQIVRKAAGDRVIEVDPAVRQVYVEVAPATLEAPRGDWERLQDALAEQWQLTDLTIDYPARRHLQQVLREGNWTATVTIWQGREVLDVRPGYREGAYGLAVDIGSTTVAGHLVDLRTGEVVATESTMNPQV